MKNSEKVSNHATADVHATIVIRKTWLKKKKSRAENILQKSFLKEKYRIQMNCY